MTEDTAWFADALSRPVDVGRVTVGGVSIAYRVWDAASARSTIVLVHGGAAHSRWWDPIAPFLAGDDRVIALDLSGHGDSGWREDYSIDAWAGEVLAVVDAAAVGAVTLVGHSLGGLVSTHISTRPPSGVTGAVVVDSPVAEGTERQSESAAFAASRHRIYPTVEDAVARFRPVPFQDALADIADHIARLSVRPVAGGWTWKFDRRIFAGGRNFHASPAGAAIRYGYVRAENGLVLPGVRAVVEDAGGTHVELPLAGHAPMLDQPMALVTVIRAFIAGWRADAR